MESENLLEKMYQRLEFILDSLPAMETVIQEFQAMAKNKAMSKRDFDRMYRLYNQMSSFYVKCLEIVRLTMIYFPPKMDPDEAELVSIFRGLAPDSRKSIMTVFRRMKSEAEAADKDTTESGSESGSEAGEGAGMDGKSQEDGTDSLEL